MGILKEAGEAIIKYGEIIVNKTEELAKIAKLNVDIKRMQIDQGIAEKEIGRYVMEKIDAGAASIDCSDAKIKEQRDAIISLKEQIENKKMEIEKIKSEAKSKSDAISSRKPESGPQ